MKNNILNLADSYKYSHANQYPANTVSMYDYMESRGGVYPATVFVGLQYYIKQYLMSIPTQEEVDKTRDRCQAHGVPFDYDGWSYIVQLGYLPIKIKAVDEGSLVLTKHVLMTIESTDPKVPWIAGFTETILMKLWYPTTIATKSYYAKQMLEKYGSPEWAQFAYHNFGDRGSSSVEAAAIGGFAHSTQFMGTDNFNSLDFCEEFYGAGIAESYSVFATEHSSTTSYGRDNEEQFVYDQLLTNPDAPIMSFVADSYDVYAFTEFCTHPDSRIRKLIESRPNQKFVLRPDSGHPINVIKQMLAIMVNNDCFDTDIEGKALSTNFGILWGDGITPHTIETILKTFTTYETIPAPDQTSTQPFAAENFVFGSGGDLMQNVNRDTQKFAIKCSSITRRYDDPICKDGQSGYIYEDIDVYKDPITDHGKASKKGKVTTWFDTETKEYIAGIVGKQPNMHCVEALSVVFENGKLLKETTLAEIRNWGN
jgi:nicotinamide phosphoribosyltransferase